MEETSDCANEGRWCQTLIQTERNSTSCYKAAGKWFWPAGIILKVHFLDGTTIVQQRVMETAQEWSQYANITFAVTQNRENSHIRITFKGKGSWSRIGRDCEQVA